MTDDLRPVKLGMRNDETLEIQWSDGAVLHYPVSTLRSRCPCATCREKRGAPDDTAAQLLPVLSAAETQPLRIQTMNPIGNYAYSIQFSDGHDTGIYTLEFLRELGDRAS